MIFDTENLDTITLKELGVLLLLYDKSTDRTSYVSPVSDVEIQQIIQSLYQRQCIIGSVYTTDFKYNPPIKHIKWSIVEKGKQLLADNCVKNKSVKKAISKETRERCLELSKKLMELYPAGTKPGTSVKWRGYSKNVSEKLIKLIEAGNEFTDEEAIEATKAYIGSFNGNYTTMRVLPYFLSKNVITGGETNKTCDFMSYVEDLRNNTLSDTGKDWEVKLK